MAFLIVAPFLPHPLRRGLRFPVADRAGLVGVFDRSNQAEQLTRQFNKFFNRMRDNPVIAITEYRHP